MPLSPLSLTSSSIDWWHNSTLSDPRNDHTIYSVDGVTRMKIVIEDEILMLELYYGI
jgi:hypothetical protein